MKPVHLFAAAIAVVVASAASAQTTTYTTPATFAPMVAAGSYFEDFNDELVFGGEPTANFAGGAFSYTVSAPGTTLYGEGSFIGTAGANLALVVTFTGAPVTAVGGSFYATNFSDQLQAVPITITLSNGSVTTFTPTSLVNSFRGFTTTSPITSLTLSPPGGGLYGGIDSLRVGSVVPEPGTMALWLAGLAAVGGVAVRRRKQEQAA